MPDGAGTPFSPDLLSGQIAIVTGGGTGLGRATALELAACGATVVVCGRRLEPLRETVGMAPTGRCSAEVCDIREDDQVESLVDAVLARHERIDILVNNAGGQFLSPAEAITPKGFRSVMRLNIEGTWLMTHTVATRAMIPSGRGGRVVSVTISPRHGLPGMAHSSAARAAVETLTRVLAVEWARFGIRLNAIAAGQFGTDTFMTKYPEPVTRAAAGLIPSQRLGRPEELAALVAYLAAPIADFVTGAVIALDGGRDNWLGPWPPRWAADEAGKPLAEDRRT
jgi:citronellol/citronellal dehydrogenase